MNTCPQCGHPVNAGDVYCGNCGQPLQAPAANHDTSPPQASPPPPPAAAVPGAAPQPGPAPGNQAAPPPMYGQYAGAAGPAPMGQPGMIPPAGNAPGITPHPDEKKALIGMILGIIGIPGALIPILGWGLGIAGIILSTKARRTYKHLTTTLGIVFSVIALVLSTIVFIIALEHVVSQNKQKLSSTSTSTSSVQLTQAADTPCFSTDINSGMTLQPNNGACTLTAYGNHSSYIVNGENDPAITSANFQDISTKSLAIAIQSQNLTQNGNFVKTTFANSPAYLVNITDKASGLTGQFATVLHKSAPGDNFFIVGAVGGGDYTLANLQTNWQWK